MSRKISIKYVLHLVMAVGLFFCVTAGSGLCETGKNPAASDDVGHWLAELEKRRPERPVAVESSAGNTVHAVSGLSVPQIVQNSDTQPKDVDSEPAKITVDFYKVDIHNVFRLLGEISGRNIVVDEAVGGTLTLALKDVPWTFVLDVIKNLKGLASMERENTLMIFPEGKSLSWHEDVAEDIIENLEIVNEEPEESGLEITQENTLEMPNGELVVRERFASKTPVKDRVAAEKLMQKAQKYENEGNMLTAYEYIRKAVKLWPDNVDINKKIAYFALQEEDDLTAYNYGRKAFILDPSDNESAAMVAIALSHLGKNDEASWYFEKAMASDNIPQDIMWNYAVFSFSNGKYRQTLRILDKIDQLYDLTPDVIMLKAQALEYLDRKEQAAAEYRIILNAGGEIPDDMIQFAHSRLSALEMKITD